MGDSNKVTIQSKDAALRITSITYLNGTLHAPFGTAAPTIVKKSDSKWEVTVNCEKDGSETYAKEFNTRCGSPYHEYAPDGGGYGNQPDKLNLFFGVKIEFAYGSGVAVRKMAANEVYFGQGHYGISTNNWWIGGRSTIDNTELQSHTMLVSDSTNNFLLGISGGTSNFDLKWKGDGPPPSLSKWIGTLSDSTSLTEMSIPGTHDSCAVYSSAVDAFTITQTQTLRQQLEQGIRFLDIRCRHIGNVFTIHHGQVYQHLNFGNGVLKECLEFLEKNPSETIIMSIKEEYDPEKNTRSFEATFMSYLSEYHCHDNWYLGETVPTLGSVRGKLVLFRRFEALMPLGLKALPWQKNQTFSVLNNKANMEIQDQYEGVSFEEKWNIIKAFLQTAKDSNPQMLFVNFCSASTSPSKTPQTYANYINPQLAIYFGASRSGRYGCVLMDYEQAGINQLIINTNK